MFGTQMTDEFFARAHRRRRRVPQRRAQGAARRGRRSTASSCASTPRASTSCSTELERRVVRRPRAAVGRDARRHGALRPDVRVGERRRCSSGRWASPSTSTAPTTSPRSSTSASRAATSGGPAPGSCPSAATPACRAAPRWAPTPPRSRAASPIGRRRRPPRWRSSTGSRSATAPASPRRRWSKPAARGELDVLYSSGGNFLEVLPDPEPRSTTRSRRVPLRVHQDIVVSSQMLVDPGEVVVLLPAATRYEQRDGGTETTTERRIAFSPEIAGHQAGRGAQRVGDLRRPGAAGAIPIARTSWRSPSGQAIRDEIARVVPSYAGVETLARDRRRGAVGRHAACATGGSVPDARRQGAVHAGASPADLDVPEGSFVLSTRRGKQFNTMVHDDRDPLTGADRDALFIARPRRRPRSAFATATRSSCAPTTASSGARLHVATCGPATCRCSSPRATCCCAPGGATRASGVPDYNAVVTVEAR